MYFPLCRYKISWINRHLNGFAQKDLDSVNNLKILLYIKTVKRFIRDPILSYLSNTRKKLYNILFYFNIDFYEKTEKKNTEEYILILLENYSQKILFLLIV